MHCAARKKEGLEQGRIWRKEESRIADKEEYAGRTSEDQKIGRNMHCAGRKKEELETERNMQKGGKQDSRQGGIYRQEEWRARDREE
jgi:hypothetical protein